MEPAERASIEAQVILKAAVELAVAEIGNEPDGVPSQWRLKTHGHSQENCPT